MTTNPFIVTREQLIEQINERYAQGELMFVPFTYTAAIVSESISLLDDDLSDSTPLSDEDFNDYIDSLANDDDFWDDADIASNQALISLLRGRDN